MAELLSEKIEAAGHIAYLDEDKVELHLETPDEDWPAIVFKPETRKEANQMSALLRRASKRLEEIAHTFPPTAERER